MPDQSGGRGAVTFGPRKLPRRSAPAGLSLSSPTVPAVRLASVALIRWLYAPGAPPTSAAVQTCRAVPVATTLIQSGPLPAPTNVVPSGAGAAPLITFASDRSPWLR